MLDRHTVRLVRRRLVLARLRLTLVAAGTGFDHAIGDQPDGSYHREENGKRDRNQKHGMSLAERRGWCYRANCAAARTRAPRGFKTTIGTLHAESSLAQFCNASEA